MNKSATTITVGCKLPHGLIIHLAPPVIGTVVALNGRKYDQLGEHGPSVRLHGMNSRTKTIIGGYGLTQVPKDYWDQWVKENPKHPYLQNGLLFAHENRDVIEGLSTEYESLKTGLEGLDPLKPGPNLKPENYEGMPKTMTA